MVDFGRPYGRANCSLLRIKDLSTATRWYRGFSKQHNIYVHVARGRGAQELGAARILYLSCTQPKLRVALLLSFRFVYGLDFPLGVRYSWYDDRTGAIVVPL